MNKLTRFYNQNRKIIWVTIFVLILIISVPRALNNYAIKKKQLNQSSSNENITTTSGNKDNPIISGGTVKEEKAKENNSIINTFLDYCNNKNVENAYNLLSNKCKEKLYPTLEDFINYYYNVKFENNKTYDIQAWYTENGSYTYKINLKEDILASGNANILATEDYYTIVEEDGENKLNINGYIKTEDINKLNETYEVKVNVLSKDIYIDYEIYNLNVENKTEKPILLDSLEHTNTMYLENSNGLHFDSYSHEMVIGELRVKTHNIIKIKFNKKYTTKTEITKMVFSDIVLDYDSYLKTNNKSEFDNRTDLEIEM